MEVKVVCNKCAKFWFVNSDKESDLLNKVNSLNSNSNIFKHALALTFFTNEINRGVVRQQLLDRDIRNIEDAKKDLDSMKTCPNCKSTDITVTSDDELSAIDPKNNCLFCKNVKSDNCQYCSNCGKLQFEKCEKCGSNNYINTKFCSKCGITLSYLTKCFFCGIRILKKDTSCYKCNNDVTPDNIVKSTNSYIHSVNERLMLASKDHIFKKNYNFIFANFDNDGSGHINKLLNYLSSSEIKIYSYHSNWNSLMNGAGVYGYKQLPLKNQYELTNFLPNEKYYFKSIGKCGGEVILEFIYEKNLKGDFNITADWVTLNLHIDLIKVNAITKLFTWSLVLLLFPISLPILLLAYVFAKYNMFQVMKQGDLNQVFLENLSNTILEFEI